jgi:hypothetical protein
MAGFMAIATIAFIGIVATIGWVACVSLGIRRADRHGLAMTLTRPDATIQLGSARSAVSRVARHSTGLHRA